MAASTTRLQTCSMVLPANPGPTPTNSGNDKSGKYTISEIPIHIITDSSKLPHKILSPSSYKEQVIGFDCEGVKLGRLGTLCIMQIATQDAVYIIDAVNGGKKLMQACKPMLESDLVTKVIHDCKRDSEALYHQFSIKLQNVIDTQIAYHLLEEQEGRPRPEYISFVNLLADRRYCGISYGEKEEVRKHLKEDSQFWMLRPLTENMVFAAADDVRYLPLLYYTMKEKLNQKSLWQLEVRGALYCRCFCEREGYADWPCVPPPPDSLVVDGEKPKAEVISVLDVPQGKMSLIIGRSGKAIRAIKGECRAEIITVGPKQLPQNKVFIIGLEADVEIAKRMLRKQIEAKAI